MSAIEGRTLANYYTAREILLGEIELPPGCVVALVEPRGKSLIAAPTIWALESNGLEPAELKDLYQTYLNFQGRLPNEFRMQSFDGWVTHGDPDKRFWMECKFRVFMRGPRGKEIFSNIIEIGDEIQF